MRNWRALTISIPGRLRRGIAHIPVMLVLGISIGGAAQADPADGYVRAFMARTHAPGVALAVIRDGRVVEANTWGVASLEWRQPVGRDSLFWCDSLTKLFTAIGVMQLAEQGKLSLDDPITKYLPGAPPAWKAVTVRHLLTHTSGIRDDYWQLYRGSPLLNYDAKDIYAYATSQPLVFKPGHQFAYSNEGYYLLGLIIAKVTGQPYTAWITAHVLRPAGMKTARMYNAREIIPHMVYSYALKDGRVVHNRADIMSDRGEAIAGWGLYASLDDMIAFDAALRAGRLLSRESMDQLWRNATLDTGYPGLSGIGFSEITYPRDHRQALKGGQAGVKYAVFPDNGVSVILLTNMEESQWGDSYAPSAVAHLFVPTIQPLSALRPHPDPDLARTANLRAAVNDMATGVAHSPHLLPAFEATLTPELRAEAGQLLPAMPMFQFLACEKASPGDPHPASTYCYYRAHAGPTVLDIGFGLTADGRLAAVTGQPE